MIKIRKQRVIKKVKNNFGKWSRFHIVYFKSETPIIHIFIIMNNY